MKSYTLDQVQDKLIGKIGTHNRDLFEYELGKSIVLKHRNSASQSAASDEENRQIFQSPNC